jgi:hypothetical protein
MIKRTLLLAALTSACVASVNSGLLAQETPGAYCKVLPCDVADRTKDPLESNFVYTIQLLLILSFLFIPYKYA